MGKPGAYLPYIYCLVAELIMAWVVAGLIGFRRMRARQMVTDPDHPVGKAIQDGVAAAKRKREELEAAATRKMQQTNGEETKA